MDSLANYGSDDEYEENSQDKKQDWRSASRDAIPKHTKQEDVNYEEVQMELSEGSDDSEPRSAMRKESRVSKEYSARHSKERDTRPYDRKSSSSSASHHDSKSSSRYDRDRDRERDRYNKDRKYSSRRSSSRERERRRSRSRSPSRRSKISGSTERNRRDGSRERSGYSKRYDRTSNKMAQLEKLGIEIKTPDSQFLTPSELQKSMEEQKKKNAESGEKDRFFMPGITGRFREQIERRKLLWQKKEPEKKEQVRAAVIQQPVAGTSRAPGKVWEATTFAQDQDGKVASKFKRLMGIRGASEGNNPATDTLKKQEEMFSSMEQQYEVARTATHTMRGVGLGFGSFQR